MQQHQPSALLRQTTVCALLDLSRNGLACLLAKDPSFPKPIKLGEARQAPVYFDAEELRGWIEQKKQARAGA